MSVTLTMPSVTDYQQAWAHGVENALSRIAASRFKSKLQSSQSAAPPIGECAGFSIRGPVVGETALYVTSQDALTLSQLFLNEKLDPAAKFTSERRDALQELFKQVGIGVATALTSSLGDATDVTFSGPGNLLWLAASPARFDLKISGAGVTELTIHAAISPDLSAILASGPASARKTPPRSASAAAQGGPNLEVLKDIEINVALRFGKTNVPLRQVLELAPGAALELDQNVHDPVELLVGNKVVARGEVVVVDGNYALRVTEVVSARERIESLYP
jgi:flagellar motor switch protein FliN/FliY